MPPGTGREHAGIIMATELQNLSNKLAETVERAAASIVAVHGRRGVGSSGIAWRDNLILTTSEGVRAEEGIKVGLPDGRVTTARLRGRDSGTDLAVLEIEGGLPPLNFADDAAFKAGQLALAVGRTANTGPIASFGIISGVSTEWKTWRGGKLDPFVRLDISAYPTLSGGAALSADGNLIGLVSTGLSRSSVFAVTRSTIDRIAGKLSQQGYVSRGFLGIALQPVALPPQMKETLGQDAGIMLVGIEPEGPAAVGGLILGDVLITSYSISGGDAQSLAQPEALAELLERTPAGQSVKFKVLRAGILQDVDVRLGERPSRRR
jgi:serine protease Do